MPESLITTIIPTFRRPAMLRRAIRSVLSQTYKEFRLCIYDNASGDETESVADEFRRKDSRIEYLKRETNIGAHRNFVESASCVETPFFSFLPDDDLLLPNFFEDALAGFRRHPEAALSILATLHVTPRGFVRDAWIMEWPEEGFVSPPAGLLHCLTQGNPGLHAILIRNDIWGEFGGFDESTEPAADFDFELRVGAQRPIIISRKPGAIQVVHIGSSTSSADLHWVWPALPRITKKVRDMDLAPAARDEALARLSWLLKRGLIVRGGLRALVESKWEEAESTANILEGVCGQVASARMIRRVAWLCRHLPFTRLAVRALLKLRLWQKAVQNIRVQLRYRGYRELLRA